MIPTNLRRPALLIPLLGYSLLSAQQEIKPDLQQPQETLQLALRRLQTTTRILHTTAHPDDEDGGMLVLESHGKGATVTLLTLNRGEGGQNKVGSNLFDALGQLRTLELLASDRYYGVEQRFTRVADFGYSKNSEETFSKWGGHDIALDDMVRVIRTFRPDVIVSRFQGTSRDGHGHHEAAGILSKEAFRVAADRNRFPEQITEGLLPWQAKKLYMDNVRADEDYTLKLNTGVNDLLLGTSYIQFAMNGLRHQLSQGAGSWHVEPGDRFTYYKLIDTVIPGYKPAKEQDFMDGIDASLTGLASRLGSEQSKVPSLRTDLEKVEKQVEKAIKTAKTSDSRAAAPLFSGLNAVEALIKRTERSSLSPTAKAELLTNLATKRQQFEDAIGLATGLQLQAFIKSEVSEDSPLPIVPGQEIRVVAHLGNQGKLPLMIAGVSLDLSGPVASSRPNPGQIVPGANTTVEFNTRVPEDASPSRPYYHRDDPETDTVYTIDHPSFLTLPMTPPAVVVRVNYAIAGGASGSATISAPVEIHFLDISGAQRTAPLAIAPAFSVLIDPASAVLQLGSALPAKVSVTVTGNSPVAREGTLRLEVPAGWRAEPASQNVEFAKPGEQRSVNFDLFPSTKAMEEKVEVRAVLDVNGKRYSEGYSIVSREDLGSAYYYQPATQRISLVDVKLPPGLRVGYVMGAGDEIPTLLRELGLDTTIIAPETLATGDLSRYGTIVLGIRAYDTRGDVRQNNQHLLDFVKNGGTLIVQYNSGVGDFNSGHFTPFPAELSRDRVSVEEAPVDILEPANPVFHFPNRIMQSDFNGWVQERGLCFMRSWDPHFEPLLSSHDPGEQPMQGGLLLAHYGKGLYIYDGYAFFRQLPNGVPGAVRLFVNLLSAGFEH